MPASTGIPAVSDALHELLDDMEKLLEEVEEMPDPDRERVFALLDGVDALHRLALTRLGEVLGEEDVERVRQAHPAIAWLLDAYGVGAEEPAAQTDTAPSLPQPPPGATPLPLQPPPETRES